jgi:hypothetical protein
MQCGKAPLLGLAELRQRRLLGRFFASGRQWPREVGERPAVSSVANLGGWLMSGDSNVAPSAESQRLTSVSS